MTIEKVKAVYLGIAVLLMITFSSCATLFSAKNVSENPEHTKLITSDIENFYKAFDLAINDSANATRVFDLYYFSKGSKGLRDFYKSKIHSRKKFSEFVMYYKDFYQSIRPNVSDLSDLEKKIFLHFHSFKSLYPKAVFPDVYFLMGRFSSNGTISDKGLLIGTEIMSRSDDINTEDWNDDILRISMLRSHIPVTVSHELVHSNQKNMKGGNTLLWKSIREGSAEFIGELISGHTDGSYKEFEGIEQQVLNDFKQDMHKSIWLPWQQANESRPQNAGYWVGYTICKAYLKQVTDEKQAVYDILHIKDYEEFYKKSRVEDYIAENSAGN